MATHSSTLAWKIPWMENPGRPWGRRVRHATSLSLTFSLYSNKDIKSFYKQFYPHLINWYFIFLMKYFLTFIVDSSLTQRYFGVCFVFSTLPPLLLFFNYSQRIMLWLQIFLSCLDLLSSIENCHLCKCSMCPWKTVLSICWVQ